MPKILYHVNMFSNQMESGNSNSKLHGYKPKIDHYPPKYKTFHAEHMSQLKRITQNAENNWLWVPGPNWCLFSTAPTAKVQKEEQKDCKRQMARLCNCTSGISPRGWHRQELNTIPTDMPMWMGELSQGLTHRWRNYMQLMAAERGGVCFLQRWSP